MRAPTFFWVIIHFKTIQFFFQGIFDYKLTLFQKMKSLNCYRIYRDGIALFWMNVHTFDEQIWMFHPLSWMEIASSLQ